MKKKAEKDRIRRGLNILVATPGRLCDHLDTTIALDLSKVEYLIFDEADRMLDMDFEKKINFIIFKLHSTRKKASIEPDLPKYKLDENGEPIEEPSVDSSSNKASTNKIDPQTILISATLTNGIKEIARRLNVNNPISIDALSSEEVDDGYIRSDENARIKYDDKKKEEEKIALPSGLTHYYFIVPSKLRLISLISFILDKFVVS
jgi:ATP-dependent RNA helicase DDX31/DBP7